MTEQYLAHSILFFLINLHWLHTTTLKPHYQPAFRGTKYLLTATSSCKLQLICPQWRAQIIAQKAIESVTYSLSSSSGIFHCTMLLIDKTQIERTVIHLVIAGKELPVRFKIHFNYTTCKRRDNIHWQVSTVTIFPTKSHSNTHWIFFLIIVCWNSKHDLMQMT